MMPISKLTGLSLAVLLGFGLQPQAQGQTPPEVAPPAAPISAHPETSVYVSDQGRFTVSLPEQPETSTHTITMAENTLTWTLTTARTPASAFAIAYTDLPLDVLAQGQAAVLDSLQTQPLLAGLDWAAISNRGTAVYLDGIPGREHLHLSQGRFSAVQFYLVNRRLYAVMATAPTVSEIHAFTHSFALDDPWRSFVSETGGFSVDVPSTPIVTPHRSDYQGEPFTWRQFTIYNLMAAGETYHIAYTDLPANLAADNTTAWLSDIVPTVLPDLDATALAAIGTPVLRQGYTGRQYLLTGNNGLSYVVQFYQVDNRLYGIVASSRSVQNLDRFLSSFHFR